MTYPEGQSPQRSTTEPAGQMEMTIGERRRFALIVTCCLFGGLNCLGPVMLEAADSALPVALITGAISAELALTATWAVLGPGRACWRFLAACLATAGLAFVLLVLFVVTLQYGPDAADILSMLLFLPLVFLAAQVPLWLLRFVGGYQLVDLHQPRDDGPVAARQFDLAHLFGATTVLAVTFGLARCGIQLWDADASQVWIGLLITCGFVVAYVVLTTLPSLWAVFGPRKNRGLAIFLLAFYSLALGLASLAFLSLIFGPAPGEAVAAFMAFHAALVIATVIPFALLRALDYRLERPGKTLAAIQPDEQPDSSETACHGGGEMEEQGESPAAGSPFLEETG